VGERLDQHIVTNDTLLAAEVWTPTSDVSRGAAVFVHGFAGGRHENGLFSVLAEGLAEAGFHSVLYDWRGIGDSQGEFHSTRLARHVADFEVVRDWTREQFAREPGQQLMAVGFSLGAALAVLALGVDRLALLSPALRPAHSMWSRYRDDETLWEAIAAHGFAQKPGSSVLLGEPILRSLRIDPGPDVLNTIDVPTLVCHGTADARIPYAHTLELIKQRKSGALFRHVPFDNASHSFKPSEQHWPQLTQKVVNWARTDN
jgi:alpha-beta hydrolase superfamily lysophospholipase